MQPLFYVVEPWETATTLNDGLLAVYPLACLQRNLTTIHILRGSYAVPLVSSSPHLCSSQNGVRLFVVLVSLCWINLHISLMAQLSTRLQITPKPPSYGAPGSLGVADHKLSVGGGMCDSALQWGADKDKTKWRSWKSDPCLGASHAFAPDGVWSLD